MFLHLFSRRTSRYIWMVLFRRMKRPEISLSVDRLAILFFERLQLYNVIFLCQNQTSKHHKFRSNLFSVYANAMILFLICYGVPTSFFKWHVILIITMLSEILNDKFLAIFMIRIKNSL